MNIFNDLQINAYQTLFKPTKIKNMFSNNDFDQIKKKGIDIETIKEQILNFENGFPFSDIIKPATIVKGMMKIADEDLKRYINIYQSKTNILKTVKFVPASGAASRMFKDLFSFITKNKGISLSNEFILNESNNITVFFGGLKKFAFYNDLNNSHHKLNNKSIDESLSSNEYAEIVESLLSKKGLNYGNLPKGLLKFHSYQTNNRTPVEEHLVEGANYVKTSDNKVNLHFTVSPEHKEKFISHINSILKSYEKKFGVTYNITFSEQKSATDTIAVTLENVPFRNSDNSLLFRPAGHGSIIENLNDLEGDIIFVKNIDNVVPDKIKEQTFVYKKALAGLLISIQEKIFSHLKLLERKNINHAILNKIALFTVETLFVIPPIGFEDMNISNKIAYLKEKLNRPIRVCGMVKNEGEPGGGPFWVKNADNSISLQVVETVQIDMDNLEKQEIVKNATHFNPVDLICGIKDYKGSKFDLLEFRDPKSGFISQKSKDGKDLKAQELPGLWNGAMANWNTIFVEVPIITFNPVKTINDLIRDQHL